MADATADADHIGLKGIDDIRYAGCEIENILIDDFFSSLVARTHGIKRSSAVDAADIVTDEIPHGGIGIVAHGIFSLADKRGGGRIALPAASASAGAGFAVRDDDHMTHLARGIVDTGDELAVYDNTAADSGSESDGDKAVDSLACARLCFAECGAVRVVVEIDSLLESRLKDIARGNIIESEVIRIFDNAVLLVDRTGGSDTYADNIVHGDARIYNSSLDSLGNILKNSFRRAGAICLELASADDFHFFIDDAGNDIRAAEIDSYSVHFFTSR